MYTVKIKTLTPIWTGDVDRECKKIKETGIIGSLRWWYEAIVRGYGGYACDPTNSDCNEKDHCDACELFGCTGWSRKFRIEVNEDTSIAPFLIVKPKSSRKQWFLGFLDQGGILGNLKFKIVADVETQNFLKFLLDFSSSWGIGSRTQVGFGIGKLAKKDYDLDRALNFVEKYFQIQDNITNLPNLKDFFFTRIKLKQISEKDIESILDGCIFKAMQDVNNNNPLSAKEFLEKLNDKYKTYYPTAPFVRSVLRRLISNESLRHYLFGFVYIIGRSTPLHKTCLQHVIQNRNIRNKWYCPKCKRGNLYNGEIHTKIASKIYASHIYKIDKGLEFKIWGWIPKLDLFNVNRNQILNLLNSNLKKEDFWRNCFGINSVDIQSLEWLEFNSDRDTKQKTENLSKFIKENLLEVDDNGEI